MRLKKLRWFDMSELNIVGRAVTIATPKDGGGLFWQNGVFESQNDTHYFVNVNGKLTAFLRASVLKMEIGKEVV
jgi:hypothetical protein